jgi:hypothetical protein
MGKQIDDREIGICYKYMKHRNKMNFPCFTCLQMAARYGSGIVLTLFRKSARDPPSMYSKIIEMAPLS